MSFTKEQREENLINLKNAIDLGSIEQLIEPSDEWGGAYVIITSSEEKILNLKNDDGFYGHKDDTFVLTKHSEMLSGLFYYVKENVLESRDNYLYGFMALLANDYIRQNGDNDDYLPFLKYIIDKIYSYFLYFDWENGMGNPKEAFDLMRFHLSDEISDDEIRRMVI